MIGPQMVQRTSVGCAVPRLARPAGYATWVNACDPDGVRYRSGSRGSGSISTRSLQSPPVLVNPHATEPLLPTTTLGSPGSVTPVMVSESRPLTTSDARYQMFGTLIARCMSLPTSAPPVAVLAPATAQLLLPSPAASSLLRHAARRGLRDSEAQRRFFRRSADKSLSLSL